MSLEALIFDVDGTLSNTEKEGHLVAFNLAFKELKLDWSWSNNLYYELLKVTGGKLRIKYYLKKYKPEFKHDDLDNFIKSVHELKTEIFADLMNEGKIPLRTGVENLINEAREANLRLAIATTTTKNNVDVLINNTLGSEAIDWFEIIAAGNVVPNLKPAADIYNYVLDKMSIDAKNCIAFEDSEMGLLSARAANLKTVITVSEYTKLHRFDDAMVVLDNLGEKNKPFNIIKGASTNASYVNVNYLKELYEQSS